MKCASVPNASAFSMRCMVNDGGSDARFVWCGSSLQFRKVVCKVICKMNRAHAAASPVNRPCASAAMPL